MVADRLAWFGIALLIAAVAAAFFDRFDSARATRGGSDERRNSENGAVVASRAIHLTPLASSASATRFGALVLAELRLMLKGRRWWSWGVFAGLLVAQAAAPLADARHTALAFAWLWPILVWSDMGTREARHGTGALLFSAPRSLFRQLPALWLAGVVVAMAAGSVAALRLLLSGDLPGLLAWGAGACFVPSLALALGCASGTSKLFEALYTVLWYIGPVQGAPARELDFFGALPANAATAPAWLAAAALLVVISVGVRRRRMRG
jgi:hypothetical protein